MKDWSRNRDDVPLIVLTSSSRTLILSISRTRRAELFSAQEVV